MPTSARRLLAKARRSCTQEPLRWARRGISRDHTPGLDYCSSAQTSLRALLCWLATRPYPPSEPFRRYHLSRLLFYSWYLSAQHDLLAMFVDHAPDNIVGHFVPNVPGLRVLRSTPAGLDLIHTPTRAVMHITTKNLSWYEGWSRTLGMNLPAAGCPLSHSELAALAAVPAMSPDAQQLLAGLWTRLPCSDPADTWGIMWFFSHDSWPNNSYRGDDSPVLTGSGDRWQLRWFGGPPAEQLVAAFTTPAIAMPGVTIETANQSLALKYRSATMELERGSVRGLGSVPPSRHPAHPKQTPAKTASHRAAAQATERPTRHPESTHDGYSAGVHR